MKYEITFSEIIRYRPITIEAETLDEAEEKFYDMDLEKDAGIADVETEDYQIKEVIE